MAWPRDDAKLDRVRSLMADQGIDAIVARAPDNVVYLTDFWGMKGWDAVVFPREGEPTLNGVAANFFRGERQEDPLAYPRPPALPDGAE